MAGGFLQEGEDLEFVNWMVYTNVVIGDEGTVELLENVTQSGSGRFYRATQAE